jgi:atypical dual specificity phosphatase
MNSPFVEPATPSPLFNKIAARALFAPTLLYNCFRVLLGHFRWWDEVIPGVYLGAIPFFFHVPRLKKIGISAVVNCCDEYSGPVKSYEKFGIQQLHLPITDFVAPTPAEIETAVQWMRSRRDEGCSVYVHCKAGRARSATMVLCYLISTHPMTAEQAQALLQSKRPQVYRWIYRRPAVIEFIQRDKR